MNEDENSLHYKIDPELGFPIEVSSSDPYDFANEDEAARYLIETWANYKHPNYDSEDVHDLIINGEVSEPLLLAFFEQSLIANVIALSEPEYRRRLGSKKDLLPVQPSFLDQVDGDIREAKKEQNEYSQAIEELFDNLSFLPSVFMCSNAAKFYAEAMKLPRSEIRGWLRMNGHLALGWVRIELKRDHDANFLSHKI